MQLAALIMRESGMLDVFKVSTATLSNFLADIAANYHANNPYHNLNHGVHVLHGCFMHIQHGMGDRCTPLTDVEKFALLVAALGHDVDHPGVTNAFLVNSKAPLAMLYNDRSVLESHHTAMIFKTLAKPGCNVLETLSADEWWHARNAIVASVLATDMAHHDGMVHDLAKFAAETKPVPSVEALKVICHLADLGNCALTWDLSEQWSQRVCDESLAQGIEEHRLGLPSALTKLTPLTHEEVTARQLVFIDGWVRPLFNAAAILFPGARDRLRVVVENRQRCKDIVSGGASSAEGAPAAGV
uniref:PDEase domain-containing protein n=1 Tax=Haptolina ericina TaxID=156174 RepID=A0A7S3BZ67_9EUKA